MVNNIKKEVCPKYNLLNMAQSLGLCSWLAHSGKGKNKSSEKALEWRSSEGLLTALLNKLSSVSYRKNFYLSSSHCLLHCAKFLFNTISGRFHIQDKKVSEAQCNSAYNLLSLMLPSPSTVQPSCRGQGHTAQPQKIIHLSALCCTSWASLVGVTVGARAALLEQVLGG